MAKILVIDDEELVRGAIRALLESASHDVCCASSAIEGLEQLKSRECDLLITDIIMPDMDGIETIKAMRQIAPDIRIIAVSGGGRIEPGFILDAAVQLGADASLTKPFKNAEMLATVDRLLERERVVATT